MEDIVGRLAAGFFAVIAMALIPLLWIFGNLDLSQRSFVNDTVATYVEEIRSTGVITKENYEQFQRDLQKTGEVFDTNIVHSSRIAVPSDNAEGYKIGYKSYGKNDIIGVIEGYGPDGKAYDGTPGSINDDIPPREYRMKTGDYVTVTVTSLDSTTGTKFLRLATNGGSQTIKLKASAGGMVGQNRK